MTTFVLVFKNVESIDNTSSKAEIIINENDIDDVFQSIYTITISKIQKYLGKGLGWIINSVIDHTISISNYNPLAESNYIKLSGELDHPRTGLIDIENIDDNECSKWNIVRYLNLTDHHPRRITKSDKDFAKKHDFKDIKFPVKTRDIHKLKKRITSALVFLDMKIKKNIQSMHQKKCCEKNMLIYN